MSATTASWIERIGASRGALRTFNEESEAGFLQLGEMLRGLARRSKALAECAAAMAGTGGADRFRESISGFEDLMEDLREIRERTLVQGEALGRIAGMAQGFRRPAREFARTNRTFRLLGLYMRVESSRLKAEGAEFGGLSDEVAGLAAGIDECATELEESARRAGEELESGRARMEKLRSEQSAESREMLELAAAEIGALRGRCEESKSAARSLAQGCCEVRDEIGRLVTGLQYQDIQRQRLEHVCEGTERLEAGLHGGGVDGETAALAALQVKQLRSAREELRSALERIEASLSAAGTRIGGLREEALRLTDERPDLSGRGEQMQREARLCAASLGRLEGLVSEVRPVIGRMDDSAARIDETGYRIGLVALNCAVKTARLGEEGAALGVVAAELGRLAHETGLQAEALTGRLGELSEQARVLTGTERTNQDLEPRVLSHVHEAGQAEAEYLERLRATKQVLDELLDELRHRAAQPGWADRMLKRMDEAEAGLDGVAGEVMQASGESGTGQRVWSPDVERTYTMASERDIYRAHMQGNIPENSAVEAKKDETFGGEIELF